MPSTDSYFLGQFMGFVQILQAFERFAVEVLFEV